MSERQTKAGNQISLSHSHSLSFTHSRHTEQLLFSCLCSKVTLSLSHSLTLSLSHYLTLSMSHSHTLTLSLSHSLTLHMLNNFCFHVYAHQSLSHSQTLSFTLSRHAEQLLFSFGFLGTKPKKNVWMSDKSWEPEKLALILDLLKNFCFHVFSQKSQQLPSIDMKTKVVQHVESEWMRDWKSERVTFEYRHTIVACLWWGWATHNTTGFRWP